MRHHVQQTYIYIYVYDHLNILLSSSRSISASAVYSTALQSFVSSANLEILDKIPSCMSLMKTTNNSGPSTDPCATPLSTLNPIKCLPYNSTSLYFFV